MTKRISKFLAIILTVLVVMSLVAVQNVGANGTTISMTVGQSNLASYPPSGYTVQSVTASDGTNTVTATTSGNVIYLTANRVGTTTLSILVSNSGGTTSDITRTVVVSNANAANTPLNLSVNDIHSTTATFSSSPSITFSTNSIVSAAWNSVTNKIDIKALYSGYTVVSVTGIISGSTVSSTYTYSVTVNASSSGANSQNVTVAVGETATIPNTSYASVVPAVANTSNVASLSVNSNRVSFTGVSQGTVKLNYKFVDVDTAGHYGSMELNVTVTAATNNTNTTETVNLAVGGTPFRKSGINAGYVSSNTNSAVASAVVGDYGTLKELVISPLTVGTTTVILNYTVGSTNATLTYTVVVSDPKATGTTPDANSGNTGSIVFPKTAYTASKGKRLRISGIKLNGESVESKELKWVSSNTAIMSVGSQSGIFRGNKAGKVNLIAVDAEGKYAGAVTLTFK